MSTAVLISGQLRTFARCWPTQRWHVLRHFADPHFFITVQGEAVHPAVVSTLIAEYGADHVHWDPRTDPDLSADLTPELAAAYHHAPYANAAPAHQLLLQHWYQNEVWKFFQSASRQDRQGREEESEPLRPLRPLREAQLDTIIRLRGDLWFHSFELPDYGTYNHHQGGENFVLPNSTPPTSEAWTPWWGRFGGINDRFAIMGPEAAEAYFTTYEHIPELLAAGCPFHPESLVAASLERSGITLHDTLRAEFSTLRVNGESRFPEITPIDMAHAALRAAA